MAYVTQDGLLGSVDLYLPDNAGGGPYSLVGSSVGKYGRSSYPSMLVDGVDPVFGGGQFLFAQVAPITAQTVSSVTVAAGVATVTTGSAHGLVVGQPVQLAGFTPAAYNGIWQIATVPSGTTFTLNLNYVWDQRWNPNNPLIANTLKANPSVPTTSSTVQGTYVPGIGAGMVCQFVHAVDTFGNLILQAKPWAGTANSGLALGVSLGNPLALTTSSVPANPFSGQYGWFQVSGAMAVTASGAPAIGSQAYWATTGVVSQTVVASKQACGLQFASALAAVFGSGSSGTITLPANFAIAWGTFPNAQAAIT